MSYDEYFDMVRDYLLENYFRDMSVQKLTEYMKSQEDVVQDQYEYYKELYDNGDLKAFENAESGAGYSLYLLYD